MVKKQLMQWTPAGAPLLLQVRTAVLNAEWVATFRTWYPAFRPGLVAEEAAGQQPETPDFLVLVILGGGRLAGHDQDGIEDAPLAHIAHAKQQHNHERPQDQRQQEARLAHNLS